MIRITDLTKTYTRDKQLIKVLDRLDLSVERGEAISIMGPSGSGKSTLLNIIAGMDSEIEGDVEVDGRHLQQMSSNERSDYRNKNIGFIFQEYYLLPHLSNLENTIIPLIFSEVSHHRAKELGLEALRNVGLAEMANQRPSQLSGGQKQRVVIARALINRPKILLCDEPTANLDSETADNIIDLILCFAKEDGVTVIIATHSKDLARRASKTLALKDLQAESTGAESKSPLSKKMQNVRRMEEMVKSITKKP